MMSWGRARLQHSATPSNYFTFSKTGNNNFKKAIVELFSVAFKAKLHTAPHSEFADMKPLFLLFVSAGGDLSQSGRGRHSVLPLGLCSQCPRQVYLCDTA